MAASVASDLHRYKELQVTAPPTGVDAQSMRPDLPKVADQPSTDVLLRGAVYPMDGGNNTGVLVVQVDLVCYAFMQFEEFFYVFNHTVYYLCKGIR